MGMADPLLIYGATGYTGRLIVRAAAARGLRPILAGRSRDKLAALADSLGLAYRVAALHDRTQLDAALSGIRVVLHAAGPFSETARPMVDACLRAGAHYLDITAEISIYEQLAARSGEARARGITLLPGTGFDIVPSDCLAAHVARQLPGADRLALGIRSLVLTTRGSAKTFVEFANVGIIVRRDGALTSVPPGALQRRFDFGDGPVPCVNVSWGDVAAAYYSTGIPNIEVYFEATPILQAALMAGRAFGWVLGTPPWQLWLKAHADLLPEGPAESERQSRQAVLVAEASDPAGRTARARLRTPEAYTFTGGSAAAIAARVLRGDCEIGFQTPARVYGPDFVLSFDGVEREDLS
jgi:short subunit dehydrogenase-like uncharacterized protein